MAKISWNPSGDHESEAPVVWGCTVFMREDGSFVSDFKGETGFMMMKAAVEELKRIDRLRSEPVYGFGSKIADDWVDPPPLTGSPKRTRRAK